MPTEDCRTDRAVADVPPTAAEDRVLKTPPAWEVKLAETAAAQLVPSLAKCSPPALVTELLRDLAKEHRSRISQNLNHWPEYAPQYLARKIELRLAAEKVRQNEAISFMENQRIEALMYARKFFWRPEDAEDAVAEADIKLWRGETSPKFYFSKLRLIILNKVKRRYKERGLFDVTQSLDGRIIRKTDARWECVDVLGPNKNGTFRALVMNDPSFALLREDDIEEAIQEIKTNRKRRGVRDRNWWKELLEYREASRK